jgi:hypothetical protein
MTRTHQLEAAIAASASRHLAARPCPAGGAAPAALTWIETGCYLALDRVDVLIVGKFLSTLVSRSELEGI